VTAPKPAYPVEIETLRLRLREFATDDLDALYGIVGDERITHWLSFDTRSEKETSDMLTGVLERARLDDRVEYYLAVDAKDSGEMIGMVRLEVTSPGKARLGGAVALKAQRQRFALEAAHAILTFGFEDLGLHRITAAIGPENVASMTAAEMLGMQREGRLREHVFTNGAWRDSVLYSLLESEWPSTHRQRH